MANNSAMPQVKSPALKQEDVFSVTMRREAELRSSRTTLAPKELEVMVLVDGKASVAQIVRSARGQPAGEVMQTLQKLAAADYLSLSAPGGLYGAIDPGDFFSITAPLHMPAHPAERPEVADGVSSLQAKGYYVRIARPVGAERLRKIGEGEKLSALVIDDDEQLARLLRMYLAYDGFAVATACRRSEIVQAFGKSTPPDIVLLDVVLPDVDGFDVLARMRQHPILKSVPVIMLTAKATREAVLKGLYCGADGYVTKPFEVEVALTAVKTVLGISR